MKNTWFSIKAVKDDDKSADISIHDEIGGWGVTASEFINELESLGDVENINLSVHSPGGSVLDGWAIFNRLKEHPAKVTAKVEGFAGSMASVILLAADERVMPENSWQMIHYPHAGIHGTSKEMRDYSESLEKIEKGIVSAYQKRTGLDEDDVRSMLEKETFMDAAESVEFGFADSVTDSFKAAACASEWRDKLPKDLPKGLAIESTAPAPKPPRKTISKPESKIQTTERTPAMSEPIEKQETAPKQVSIKDALAADKPRREEIKSIGARFNLSSERIEKAIEDGTTIEVFNKEVVDSFDQSSFTKNNPDPEKIKDAYSLGSPEGAKFSMLKALKEVSNGGSMTGLEKEVQDELTKKFHDATGEAPTGILIPSEWWNKGGLDPQAAATVGTGTSGGNTVATEMQGLTDYLSDYSILPEIGATIFRDAVGNLEFPRSTAGYTGTWDAETDAISNADATFAANLTLSPKRVGAGTAVSKKLLLQSSTDFEAWVRKQLQKAIAESVDRAAITGTGSSDQPTGVLSASGTGSYTWVSGSALWVNIVDQVKVLRAANGNIKNAAWLTDHTVRADWKKTPIVSGAATMTIERGFKPREAMVDDLPFYDHTDVTTGKVVVGDWTDLLVALWGGIQLTYDPYSLKKSGQIEMYAETYADVGVLQPANFVIGNDGTDHNGAIA